MTLSTKPPARLEKLVVTYEPIGALRPQKRNPRKHDRKQVRQIADSMATLGVNTPIITDDDGIIVAGHGRYEAAKLLGLAEVPVIRLGGRTPAQIKAYLIADNKIAENARWDFDDLRIELDEIMKLDSGFNVAVTGFEEGELDVISHRASDPRADTVPETDPKAQPISRMGDLWLLGDHRLLCGDARDSAAYARLLDGTPAQMVFTDPPYNVRIAGNVCGLGRVKHREFVMGSGEMRDDEFNAFLDQTIANLTRFSADGSIHFICMDWRHAYALMTAAVGRYAELKNLCVWNKTNGGMGSLYRSKHEFVFVYKNGKAPHINNVELGRHGRSRTNVWDYAGISSRTAERQAELEMHPTVKPAALVADAIKDCSKRDGIILDAFCGSGTSLIAAEQTHRRACAIELDPRFVDTAIRRWQDYTGETAVHAETRLRFGDIADGGSAKTRAKRRKS